MRRAGDWHCPVCRCGGTKGTEDMHARPSWECEGAPMLAERGLKIQHVLDAARAWRKFYGDDLEGYAPPVRRELAAALDALDAPVERWRTNGSELWDDKFDVPGYQCRVQLLGATDELAAKIAAALNREDKHGR